MSGVGTAQQEIIETAERKEASVSLDSVGARSANLDGAGAQALLEIETKSRQSSNERDLYQLIVNETRKLTKARQVFAVRCRKKKTRIVSVSGLKDVNNEAPLVQDIQRVVDHVDGEVGLKQQQRFCLTDELSGGLHFLPVYPFPHLLWIPFLSRRGFLLGGMLLAREQEWQDADMAVANRLAESFQHALSLIRLEKVAVLTSKPKALRRSLFIMLALAALAGTMAIPVSMTTLAPMEVVAHKPFIVSAPIEGIIEDVLVNPGEAVRPGQPIVQLSDTVLKNRLQVSRREVAVANARLKKASQLAFNHADGRSELRTAMADLELKKAELKFAEEMFQRAQIRAQRSGHAVYSNKLGLIGKPVAVGEHIMQIADPNRIEIKIDVPVGDAFALTTGADVKVFLDSDPLRARDATIVFSDYQTHESVGGDIVLGAIAEFSDQAETLPRLGVRGTAKIFGDHVPLGYYLFRRPIAALRQWIGL